MLTKLVNLWPASRLDELMRIADETLERRARRGQVGVCGLGKMGAGLALNLVDHGWTVVGWNRHPELAQALEPDGVTPAATLRDLPTSTEEIRTLIEHPASMTHAAVPHSLDFLEYAYLQEGMDERGTLEFHAGKNTGDQLLHH